jgi:hypothetical protein
MNMPLMNERVDLTIEQHVDVSSEREKNKATLSRRMALK